jgi:ATP-dependent DNA helicase PIF1
MSETQTKTTEEEKEKESSTLSLEQHTAFDKYAKGQNIFITGPGGSGKSELIRHIYKDAIRRGKRIQVCALTGCAAILLNANAKTIHSWSGIGLGNASVDQLLSKILKNRTAKKMWRETQVLVIDEVSMLSLKLFDSLNQIGKTMRKSSRPFGGIQLIFSGDFYQLPPVGNKDDPNTSRYCFESDDWNSVFHRDCQIQLVKIFRQQDDAYVTILNQVREGRIKRKSNELLLTYVGREKNTLSIVTKLYPTKNKVDSINNSEMLLLESEAREYKINPLNEIDDKNKHKYTQQEIQYEHEYLSKSLICETTIQLKIGAHVMCIANIQSDAGTRLLLCNGSQGVVTGYCTHTGNPQVKYNNGTTMVMSRHTWMSEKIPGVGVTQVPLILAWALTIHKSQGASLDAAEIDVGSGIFECGQTYVALSRVRSLDGLYLSSFDASKIIINKKVKNFYETLTLYQEEQKQEQEQEQEEPPSSPDTTISFDT